MGVPQDVPFTEQQQSPPAAVSPVLINTIKPKPEPPVTPKTPDHVSPIHTEQIPHRLKLKASTSGSVKKATWVLAVGMFSAEERKSCTVTGGNGKEKFDQNRVSLISG